MKRRIWELDALRGVCILGMIVIHLIYDLGELFALVKWQNSPAFIFAQQWGGIGFLLISGICVTLGSRCIRRGLTVFSAGMLCTAITAGIVFLGFADKSLLIRFGILHCLGICMLLWPVFKKFPAIVLASLGVLLAALGLYIGEHIYTNCPYLFFLGLRSISFSSSDYFPLLPNFGYFLIGAAFGKSFYREKTTLLPNINAHNPFLRFLQMCGRHSLWIYLLHQPVLIAALFIITKLTQA